MKKRVLPLVLTVLAWLVMFYVALPAINIQSKEFWSFMVGAVVVAVVINMWSIIRSFSHVRGDPENGERLKRFKTSIIIIGLIAAVYLGGQVLSSPILRAAAYRDLMVVTPSNFKEDIKEVNYSQIPILDKDSASRLAEREMGQMADMVSQYEVSEYYNQINYNAKPIRVTPLRYGNEIKWLTNRKTGLPAYIRIDMTTQDAELVKLEDGIKYSPFEHFSRNLLRHLRFNYPTLMFRSTNFEIDDNGVPYWVCPVEHKTIGLFGGTDIKGAVLVNAITGECEYYNINDVPTWIDTIYDANLLVEQYNYFGTLKNGFLNSIFGQRDCLVTTEGYNYIALDDDVWVYTGVTSVGGDESLVGFVLMNQRTKETNYYPISGAKELSAMSSAQGQVQHLGYQATFPLLLNIGGEPTYFLALKDAAGLVKKYAMVNIEKYQIVAIGDTVAECEKAYKGLMSSSGIETEDSAQTKEIKGTLMDIKDIVADGNTIYYLKLDGSQVLYEVEVKSNLEILKKNIGDAITIRYVETEVPGINSVVSIQ